MIIKPDFAQASKLLHDGTLALSRVEANGIRIDIPRLDLSISRLRGKIARTEESLKSSEVWSEWRRIYGDKAKMGGRAQLATVLSKMGIASFSVNEFTKRTIADEEVLSHIDHPFVKSWCELEKKKKLANTYLAGIKRETTGGFLHCMFGLNKAITYRSHSELVNFQNLPIRNPKSGKLIRSCFIPRDGHVLVEIDYSGIEVRIAACYNEDPVLVDYISDSTKDMHRDMAAKIYLCSKEQVNKQTRYFSKNQFVFPEFYGSYYIDCARNIWEMIDRHDLDVEGTPVYEWLAKKGISKLGLCDPKKTPRQGTFEYHIKEVEDQFWKVFNVYASWKRKWYKQYLREGRFATLFGFLIQGIMKKNEAINYPIQATAFHCLLWSLIQLEKSIRMRKMGTKIVGQIHDSIVADVPVAELDDFLVLASTIMTRRIRKGRDWLIVPLEVEAEACKENQSWHDKRLVTIPV